MPEGLARAALPLLRGSDRLLERAAAVVGDASRSVRFLAGRAAFVPRADDVYIASYPRSGTTWTQAIVHLLVCGERSLGFGHIGQVVPWWERSLAWRSEAAHELNRRPGPRLFKTHLPLRWLPAGARYLYLWRNPEDVAVSYFHLYRRYLRFDGPFDAFFERFLQGEVQYGSWFRHVWGWRRERGNPRVMLLAYEDLRRSPALWIRRIARFLDLPLAPGRAEEICELTTLARMKRAQAKFDHVGELCLQWGIREGDFIREGRVGQGSSLLSAAQRQALERARSSPVRRPDLAWRLPAFLR